MLDVLKLNEGYLIHDLNEINPHCSQHSVVDMAGMSWQEYRDMAFSFNAFKVTKDDVYFSNEKDAIKFKEYIESHIVANLLAS